MTNDEALRAIEEFDPQRATMRTPADTAQIRAALHMREAAEALVTEAVARARAEGVTWLEIGVALDMTPQGARQRYRSLV